MRILLSPGCYLPLQRAGSEIYLHKVAKYLVSIGHEVKCIARCPDNYIYEGIEVYKMDEVRWQSDNVNLWNWCDIVFLQLSGTGYGMNKSRIHNKKIVSFAHNNAGYPQIPIRKNVFVVYNCENTKRELNYNQPHFVLPPPIFKEHYKDVDRTNAEYITLINHNENKGGKILIEIAKAMPDKKFLAVQGGYYKQVYSKEPNIEYVPLVEDIRPYLAMTRILIAPSEYESYGQAQVEAMCCGIPVIATDLPGFREATDMAFLPVKDRNNISKWVECIELAYGETYSPWALERTDKLTPEKDLDDFAIWLEKINKLAFV